MTSIQPGQQCQFTYPKEFSYPGCAYPAHVEHSGQVVTVLRENPDHEVFDGETETIKAKLFTVRAEDGWEGDAWADELTAA